MNFDTSSRFDSKHFKEILKKYEDSIKNNSSVYLDADEFIDIADFYNGQNYMEAAEQVIEKAYQQHPNDSEILIFISRTYAIKGEFDKAYEYLHRIADQSDREVMLLNLDLFAYQNKWKEANEVAQEIAEREEYAFETLIDLVDVFTDQHKQENAKLWLDELKNRYGDVCRDDVWLLETLSNYYFVFDEPEKSLVFFKKLIDKHPYSIEYWIGQAQCYTRLNQIPLAEESIDYALAIDDESPFVLELKGGCRMDSGDLDAAYNYFKKFEQFTINKVNAWNMLKLVTLQMDRFDETIEYCKRIVESPIASKEFKAVSYSDTALALAYKNKIKEGMSCIKEAIKLLPEEPDFYAVKGFLYLKLNDELNAEKSFNKAEVLLKKQKDKEMSCLSLIGSYCFDSQYYDGAIYYFQKIEKEYGDENPTCYLFLSYCWYQKQDLTKALHYLALVQKTTPDIYKQLGENNELIDDPFFKEFIEKVNKGITERKFVLSDYLNID